MACMECFLHNIQIDSESIFTGTCAVVKFLPSPIYSALEKAELMSLFNPEPVGAFPETEIMIEFDYADLEHFWDCG